MNKVAQRRLKLFDDAEHYGAEILKNSDWIAAVCRDYKQTHCFGRGKPKIDYETGEIIEECNLRDDEGIIPENKQKRDSETFPYVKDGIGYDDQPFEAGWCVMGGNHDFGNSTLAWGPDIQTCDSYKHIGVYCSAKKTGEVCPLITFLQLSTGKLYITNAKYEGLNGYGMLNLVDGWAIDDFNNERNGYNEGGIGKKILEDATFADICQKAVKASLEGLSDAPNFNIVECAKRQEEKNSSHRSASFSSYSRVGVSVSKFYSAIYDQLIEKRINPIEVPIVLEYNKQYYKLRGIKEGVSSCPVLDVKGNGDCLNVKDFIDYITPHVKEDRMYSCKTVKLQLKNRVVNISSDVELMKLKSVQDNNYYQVIVIHF